MFRTIIPATAAIVLAGSFLTADTLVMRDGRRIHGSLVSVSRGTVLFEQDRGERRAPTRVRLSDVERIDLRDVGDEVEGRPSGGASDDDETRRPAPDEVSTWADDDAAGRAPRHRTIDVVAGEPWTDSGLEVRAGQELYFAPEGSIIWSAGHEDGPGGQPGSPYDDRRPIPARPAGGLIGRIGTGDDTFFIGTDRGPYRMKTPGRLFLGINDDYFEDNAGSFRVTVSY